MENRPSSDLFWRVWETDVRGKPGPDAQELPEARDQRSRARGTRCCPGVQSSAAPFGNGAGGGDGRGVEGGFISRVIDIGPVSLKKSKCS